MREAIVSAAPGFELILIIRDGDDLIEVNRGPVVAWSISSNGDVNGIVTPIGLYGTDDGNYYDWVIKHPDGQFSDEGGTYWSSLDEMRCGLRELMAEIDAADRAELLQFQANAAIG